MPIDDWTFPAALVTPQGTLTINDDTQVEGFFIQVPDACVGSVEAIRAEKYGIPNADGAYLRRRFTAGYGLKLVFLLCAGDSETPACNTTDPTSTEMVDFLSRHLRAILNGGGRYLWTPAVAGSAERLLDDLWLLTPPAVSVAADWTTVSFDLDTRFPYAIDFTQIVTSFSGSDDEQILTNTGTSPFWPVWKIYGPTDGFSIVNLDTNEEIVYDADLPGSQLDPRRIVSGDRHVPQHRLLERERSQLPGRHRRNPNHVLSARGRSERHPRDRRRIRWRRPRRRRSVAERMVLIGVS